MKEEDHKPTGPSVFTHQETLLRKTIRRTWKTLARFWIVGLVRPSGVLVLRWQHWCHHHPCHDGWGGVEAGRSPDKRFPYPRGWQPVISLGGASAPRSYLRSSTEPSPWWSRKNHVLPAPELQLQFPLPRYVHAQSQAVPTKADGSRSALR